MSDTCGSVTIPRREAVATKLSSCRLEAADCETCASKLHRALTFAPHPRALFHTLGHLHPPLAPHFGRLLDVLSAAKQVREPAAQEPPPLRFFLLWRSADFDNSVPATRSPDVVVVECRAAFPHLKGHNVFVGSQAPPSRRHVLQAVADLATGNETLLSLPPPPAPGPDSPLISDAALFPPPFAPPSPIAAPATSSSDSANANGPVCIYRNERVVFGFTVAWGMMLTFLSVLAAVRTNLAIVSMDAHVVADALDNYPQVSIET